MMIRRKFNAVTLISSQENSDTLAIFYVCQTENKFGGSKGPYRADITFS